MADLGQDDRRAGATRAGFLRSVVTGILVAGMSLVFSITFASLVFSGPLAEFRDLGLFMALFGSVVYGVFSIIGGSVPGVWMGNQTTPVVVVALGAVTLGQALGDAPPQVVFATVALFMAVSTLVSGLVLIAIGASGLGQVAKFIPYPVIAGFLATTGLFLILRAIGLMTGASDGLAAVLTPDMVQVWLPYVALGIGILVLSRWMGNTAALIFVLTAFAAGFYAYLAASDLTLGDAAARGWLLGDGQGGRAAEMVMAPLLVPQARFDLILAEVWTIGAVTLLTVLGLVLNVTALEVQTRRRFDLNRDMRVTGLANIVAALAGGFPGYHSVSMYELSRHLMRDPAPMAALIATLLLAVATLFGFSVFEVLPKGIFGITLAYLGAEFLRQWLVRAWGRVPLHDFLVIVAIVATALVFDFVAAILLGLLLSMLLFVFAYSRLDVIRSVTTGAIRLSHTERSERHIETLVARGDETLVVELQGYLFFGTAQRIFDRISDAVGVERNLLSHLIIDFGRVDGMDISTSFVFGRLADLCRRNGVEMILTGLDAEEHRKLRNLTSASHHARVLPELNDALREIEERVLAAEITPEEPVSEFGALIADAEARELGLVEETRRLDAGETLFEQGASGNSVAYLSDGLLSAWIASPGKPEVRVAGFLPGAVVGEIAFAAGKPRTATIRAEEPSTVILITRASLVEASMNDPAFAAHFNARMSQLLAERLSRTTALYFASDG